MVKCQTGDMIKVLWDSKGKIQLFAVPFLSLLFFSHVLRKQARTLNARNAGYRKVL